MDSYDDQTSVVIAGASGLVGGQLLFQLLSAASVKQVITLVRRPLNEDHQKLQQIVHPELKVTNWDNNSPAPETGYICLGTTLKDAGSRSALAYVDLELVTQVAHTMKLLGVRRVGVVSSYGANPQSLSHYLRCKGKMEKNLTGMGFEQIVFMQPGPLAGERSKPRTDEVVVKWILFFLSPLLIGKLADFRPVLARDVARAMIIATTRPLTKDTISCLRLKTREIHKIAAGLNR